MSVPEMPNMVPDPAALQAQGLHAELNGSFSEGQRLFVEAWDALTAQAGRDSGQWSPDEATLGGQIARDNAFTLARWAVRDQRPELFDASLEGITAAKGVTEPFADGKSEVRSAHAATVSLVGRVMVAKQVATGEISKDQKASNEARDAQQAAFVEAHRLAQGGPNQYITTSNAMQAARAERINGRPLSDVFPWLGHAATGIVRATRGENYGFLRAARTFVNLLPDVLSTRKRAIDSVRHWRTI